MIEDDFSHLLYQKCRQNGWHYQRHYKSHMNDLASKWLMTLPVGAMVFTYDQHFNGPKWELYVVTGVNKSARVNRHQMFCANPGDDIREWMSDNNFEIALPKFDTERLPHPVIIPEGGDVLFKLRWL